MKQIIKRVSKNLYRRYTKPEACDYAVVICIAMAVGCVLNCLIKWGH